LQGQWHKIGGGYKIEGEGRKKIGQLLERILKKGYVHKIFAKKGCFLWERWEFFSEKVVTFVGRILIFAEKVVIFDGNVVIFARSIKKYLSCILIFRLYRVRKFFTTLMLLRGFFLSAVRSLSEVILMLFWQP